MIHPSSVNGAKRAERVDFDYSTKEVFVYSEKRRNMSMATAGTPMTYLVTTSRIDLLVYLLFGTHNVMKNDENLVCDGWLPIHGPPDVLEDLSYLQQLFQSSMLRVYQGIDVSAVKRRFPGRGQHVDEDSSAWEDDDGNRDLSLSQTEIKELDLMTRDFVGILNAYREESLLYRPESRPMTPSDRAFGARTAASSHNTPYGSRAGTPLSRFRH